MKKRVEEKEIERRGEGGRKDSGRGETERSASSGQGSFQICSIAFVQQEIRGRW